MGTIAGIDAYTETMDSSSPAANAEAIEQDAAQDGDTVRVRGGRAIRSKAGLARMVP